MTYSRHIHSDLQVMGPSGYRLVHAKFTPNASFAPATHVADCHGFNPPGASSGQPSRSGAGVYVFTVAPDAGPVMDIDVIACKGVPGDTNFHSYDYAYSVANRTITVTHKTCTYATIVSAGPVASDTSGEIELVALIRRSS